MKERTAAVVLAAGRGKRMQSDIPKQYLLIEDKPVVWYSLQTFQNSFVDEIILVVSKEEIEYVKKEIVERYSFNKVKDVVAGGKERYHSVACGIEAAGDCDYIFIHDGARPFVTDEMLERLLEDARQYKACVAGMPVKDTIKIADENGFAVQTPNRNLVWQVQTPQVFSYELIRDAYRTLLEKEEEVKAQGIVVTDDAMVVETFTKQPVMLTKGSYENIKITTPEDLLLAETFLKKRC